MMSQPLDGIKLFFFFYDHKKMWSSDVIDEFQGQGSAMAAVTGGDMLDQYCQYDQSSLSLGQPQSGGQLFVYWEGSSQI